MQRRYREVHFRAYGMTDAGKVYNILKKKNQDSFVINNDLGLFAVADGLGGHKGGDVASQIAIRSLEEASELLLPQRGPEQTFDETEPVFISAEEAIKKALRRADKDIAGRNRKSGEKMGTTLVCAKVHDGKVYIGNCGDSRCYQIRNGNMIQLTEDHSRIGEMVQAGRAQEKDPTLNPWRRYVKGALGGDEEIDPDVVSSIPQLGDIYLLCSDGLSKMVDDGEIKKIVCEEKDIRKACRRLIDLANEHGGKDNITVLMLAVDNVESSIWNSSKEDKEAEDSDELA